MSPAGSDPAETVCVPASAPPADPLDRTLQQAIEHHLAGRLAEAADLYRAILATRAGHPDAHHNLGALTLADDPAAALAHFHAALRGNPNQGQYWLSCVEGLLQTGQPEAACGLFEQGLRNGLRGAAVDVMRQRLEPHSPGSRLAKSRQAKSKRSRQARVPAANQPTPQETAPLMALHAEGRYAEAEAFARDLIARFPAHGYGWKALGVMLQQQGRLGEALAVKEQSAALLPHDAEAQSNLGNALLKLTRLDEAELCYRRALAAQPLYPEAFSNLGITLQKLGRLGEAEAACRRALELRPVYADAASNLGIVLQEQGRLGEAEASFRSALDADPYHPDAWNNLGTTLQKLVRMIEAEAAHRRAIALKPGYADAYTNLAGCLQQQARLPEAEACYHRAIELDPGQRDAYTNLLFCLSHNPLTAPEDLFQAHLRFARQFEAPLRSVWRSHSNQPDPERVLHVGFLSADFRVHAMSHFIEPALTALASDSKLVLHVYSNQLREDALTDRLRARIPRWNQVFGLSDAALAEKIRADGIDILVDLSGHTGGNRLVALARKPAPVQCAWIGYLGTSGLEAIDYYLADPYFLPPGRFDRVFTEKLAYVPVIAPFAPEPASPPVNPLPALSNGYLTFGSFSRMGKLSEPVVALWSQLLRALPTARLLLGAMPRDGSCAPLAGWFAGHGIHPARLRFVPGTGLFDYLELHREVDLCLDPFPFTGATTTGHAMWMGVPTMTLSGHTAPGRLGAALLRHAGLDAFVVENEADFLQKGLFWAANLTELSEIRAGLRARFLASPIGQPEIVAHGFSDAFRRMWRSWCSGSAPSHPDQNERLLALFSSGRDDQAASLAQSVLERQPANTFVLNLLGAVHQRQGRPSEAETCYRAALDADPKHIDAVFNLGRVLHQRRAFAEAEARFRVALALRPGYLQAHYSLGESLQEQGRLSEAIASYRDALKLDPTLAEAHNNLGIALQLQGDAYEAEASLREALRLRPGFAEAHNNLAIALKQRSLPQAAEASCRRAIELRPDYADAWTNLALALTEQGRMSEAETAFRHALQLEPGLAAAQSGLLFCLSHTEGSPETLFREHLRVAERLESLLRPQWARHENSPDPGRMLRIGFVSGDLRRHAMANFIEPLWEQLARDPGLSLYAYSSAAAEDAVTGRLRSHIAHWLPAFRFSDEALADAIRADRIDILVDLAGHTAGNRLRVFARRPAPIQCGWIGYLGSSGMQAIDCYLADSHFLPPGGFERQFTEKLVRLPAVACFRPDAGAPPVGPLPALTAGHFTFGSFSRPAKIGPEVVALWARLLRALPTSRMLLAAMPRDNSHRRIAGWFAGEDIAARRLSFHSATDMAAYYQLHRQVDLCLDPFPFTGATTTAHALWMGVPTLTLAGETPPGRLGAAILHSAGMGAFVADDAGAFVAAGLRWAHDLPALAGLRATLRQTLPASPLCHPALAGQGFAAVFRRMWEDWCATQASSAARSQDCAKAGPAIPEENQSQTALLKS